MSTHRERERERGREKWREIAKVLFGLKASSLQTFCLLVYVPYLHLQQAAEKICTQKGKVTEDKMPADKKPTDKMSLDKMPSDKMSADRMLLTI
jgi:hypothetical protein